MNECCFSAFCFQMSFSFPLCLSVRAVCLGAVFPLCRTLKTVLPVMDAFLSHQESYFLISPYGVETVGLYIMLRERVKGVRSNCGGISLHCFSALAVVNHYFLFRGWMIFKASHLYFYRALNNRDFSKLPNSIKPVSNRISDENFSKY